jgi:hypothetical protein
VERKKIAICLMLLKYRCAGSSDSLALFVHHGKVGGLNPNSGKPNFGLMLFYPPLQSYSFSPSGKPRLKRQFWMACRVSDETITVSFPIHASHPAALDRPSK